MFRKWAHGLVIGLLLGSLFAAFPAAQNYIWSSINGVPFGPGMVVASGGTIRTTTADGSTLSLAAYDVDGAAYTNLLTLTAGNTPYLQINTATAALLKVTGTGNHLYLENTASGGIHFVAPAGATHTFYQTGLGGYNFVRAATLYIPNQANNGVLFDTANSGTIGANGANQPASVWARTSLNVQTANAATVSIKQATTTVTCASGTTCTATNLIPAGSMVVGVTTRVTTLITGATSIDIGDGTTADLFGDNEAVTADATTGLTDHKATWTAPKLYPAATSVVLTANGSDFTAGVVRITVHYMSLSAASS